MAATDAHLLGDPDDLRRILEALDERNEALDKHNKQLATVTEMLTATTTELRALRAAILDRPTSVQIKHSRRRTLVALIIFGITLMFAQDYHNEHCSPGTRVTVAFDHLLTHPLPPTATQDQRTRDFERFYDSAPGWCDVAAPLHTHDGSHYPTPADWAGLGLYMAILAGLYGYQRGPRVGRCTPTEPDPNLS